MAEQTDLRLRGHRWVLACCAVLALVPAALLGYAEAETKAQTVTITIENMRFSPAELTVKRGTHIVWKNLDLFPHTATAKTFDSGSINANASWTYAADEPGDFQYICAFHPTMKGRLIVQ